MAKDDYRKFLEALDADDDFGFDLDEEDEADEEPAVDPEELQFRRWSRQLADDEDFDEEEDSKDLAALAAAADRKLLEETEQRRCEELEQRIDEVCDRVFDRKLAEELRLLREKKDASGHDHKGKGPGGGQFTGQGDGGSGGSAATSSRTRTDKDDSGKGGAGGAAVGKSSVKGYPKEPSKNGRDPDCSGLAFRGGKATNVKPFDPDAAADKIKSLLEKHGPGKGGEFRGKEHADLVERIFATAMNMEHWGLTKPADIAGVVREFADGKSRRVGIDLKTAMTQERGQTKKDANATALKIDFARGDMNDTASGGAPGTKSIMFYLAVNPNKSVKEIEKRDANGKLVKDANGQPVMQKAGLLYLSANVTGESYSKMIPVEVDGVDDIHDLADPKKLAKVREKMLTIIRNTDPKQFEERVKKAANTAAGQVTRQYARNMDSFEGAGVPVEDKTAVTLGKALKAKDVAQQRAKSLKKELSQKEELMKKALSGDKAAAKQLKAMLGQ